MVMMMVVLVLMVMMVVVMVMAMVKTWPKIRLHYSLDSLVCLASESCIYNLTCHRHRHCHCHGHGHGHQCHRNCHHHHLLLPEEMVAPTGVETVESCDCWEWRDGDLGWATCRWWWWVTCRWWWSGHGGQHVDGEISVFRVGTRWAPIIR